MCAPSVIIIVSISPITESADFCKLFIAELCKVVKGNIGSGEL